MTRHLLLAATVCTVVACNPASESTPAPATATTAPTVPSTSAPAVAPALAAPAIPPAPELAPLTPPGGPSAAGNVKIDVDAAMAAKDCKIVEGRLHECAAERAYLGARNNFVDAKAPDHVRTIFNLLGAEEPAVRMLVLDANPVHYVSVYLEERVDDPMLYEPLLAAALAERDPDVRSKFAAEVAEIPVYREHRRLVPYLGAIGERYTSEQSGTSVIDALAEITECKECDDALLGIARRNPEVAMRIAALVALDREGTPAETLCALALANFDVDDEDDAEKVANIFVREDPSCASHWTTWIDAFEAKAKAGVPPRAWLEAAGDILEDERGKPYVARIRAAAKALLATLPEETDLRYRVESLATES